MDFSITINGIRAYDTDDLSDVVRIVDFTITGTEAGMSYSITANTQLDTPDPDTFIPLSDLTEADVLSWVEAKSIMVEGIKGNIRHHLGKQIAESQAQSKPLPWAVSTPPPGVLPTP